MPSPLLATKWVATIKTTDGVTVHLSASREELLKTYAQLLSEFGPEMAAAWRLEEMPVTWECDGRDNCALTS
jgi:hypothetical protein